MNLQQFPIPLFERLRFVLVETSRPGNIGTAARAMKTMGFSDLVLVNPRIEAAQRHEEAIAFASGAQDVLENARVVGSLDEAIAEYNFIGAFSARLREFSPPIRQPRELAASLAANSDMKAALVFGNERFGLSNEHVEKCNALLRVPANPAYSSLNLGQAVQIMAYECRMAVIGDSESSSPIGFQGELANSEQIEGMFAHLEKALVEVEFLDPEQPKKLMPRLRRLFARTALETEEVNILRGIAHQILKKNTR